jgi:hypothetical protein
MIEYKAFSLLSSMSSAASFSQASRFSNKTDNIQGEILHLSALIEDNMEEIRSIIHKAGNRIIPF